MCIHPSICVKNLWENDEWTEKEIPCEILTNVNINIKAEGGLYMSCVIILSLSFLSIYCVLLYMHVS